MSDDAPITPLEPRTRVARGREQEALAAHIRKLVVWSSYRRAARLIRGFESEERSRRKLLKAVAVLSLLLLVGLGFFMIRLVFRG